MKKSLIQILYIHGGMTFRNKKSYINFLKTRDITIEKKNSWSGNYLDKSLGSSFQIVRPRMPLQDNAKYEEWEIVFERFLNLLKGEVILIGTSLGGIFLAKYLSKNRLNKKILSTYLVCAPFDNVLPSEDLVGGFKLKSNLNLMQKNTKNLYILFSNNDNVVPVSHAKKYKEKLPNAKIIIYKNKNGHFNISKFPEIVKMIKNDVKKS